MDPARLALTASLLSFACLPSETARRDDGQLGAALPAWAQPPPAELEIVERASRQCPLLERALGALSAARFLDATAALRETRTGLSEACDDDRARLLESHWLAMATLLDEGKHADRAEDRFEAYFKVATSETSLTKEAMRRIGTAGLDQWLADARRRCDEFAGAGEACLRPLRLLETIAPNSSQAKAAAVVIADARRVDAEMAPRVRAANTLLKGRGRLCAQLNDPDCQWAYKNPLPEGRDKLPKYGDMRPGEEREPGAYEWLETNCSFNEQIEGCAVTPRCCRAGHARPTGICPRRVRSSTANGKRCFGRSPMARARRTFVRRGSTARTSAPKACSAYPALPDELVLVEQAIGNGAASATIDRLSTDHLDPPADLVLADRVPPSRAECWCTTGPRTTPPASRITRAVICFLGGP